MGIVKVAIAAALVAFVISKVHWNDYTTVGDDGVEQTQAGLRHSLLGLDVRLAACGLAGFVLSTMTVAVRWRLLMKVLDIRLSLWEAIRLTFLGTFFNNAVPGTVGGDLFRGYYASKHTPHKAAAMVSVLIDRAMGFTELALMAAVMLAMVRVFDLAPLEQLVWPAICLAIIFAVLIGGLAFLLSRRLRRALRLQNIYGRLSIAHHLAAAGEATSQYRRQPGKLVEAVGISVIAHIFFVGGVVLLGESLSLNVPWHNYFLFIPLIYVIGAVPITPGGIGLVEQLYLVFFLVDPSQGLALALLARLMPILCGLPGLWVFLTGPRPPKGALIKAEFDADESPSPDSAAE
ncbi:hypothetical protein LCGC14_0204220 [marine sediment metagenome]|uniref:Flippase-like domain-containing protein n=1 Tax=marine sediment metagenome TaxID=412755 RepID=A0A0F9XLA8_9ZZZZ